MKMDKNLIANIIADFPIILSLPFQLLAKVFLKVVAIFVEISKFLHILFKTKTGLQLIELGKKMKDITELAKAMEQKLSETKDKRTKRPLRGNSKLFDTIMGDDDSDGKTFH